MTCGRKFALLLSLAVLALFRLTDVEGAFGIKIDSSVGSNEEEAADVNANANVNEQNNANQAGESNESKDESNGEASVESSTDVVNEASDGVDSPNAEAESESNASVESVQEEAKTDASTAAADTAASSASTPDDSQSADATDDKAAATGEQPIVQKGPFIDLFGDTLLSLEMVDETHAKLNTHYTNEALANKKVIGLYFSADWCGPCRQFTPELVSFYDRMNARKGQNGSFEIIWISRCRDVKSFGQYFTHMKWLALPPEEALGQRGQMLGEKFKVKGIPHLVLLDETGSVITYDARTKIPQDKAGIGFPWRNPLITLYITFVPKSLRYLVKSHIEGVKTKIMDGVQKVMKKGQAA